jgi:DNA-binding LytR/AlgR family response regulator
MNTTEISIGGRKKVCPDDIILLKADVNYSVLYLTNGSKIIVATTLKTLEARFSQCMFFRTNKSYLINLRYVQKNTDFEEDISARPMVVYVQNDLEKKPFEAILSRRKKVKFYEMLAFVA